MAPKKTATPTEKKAFNFKQAAKSCGNEYIKSQKSPYEFIHSGAYALNALLCGDMKKGIPDNNIIQYAGEPGVGKTYLMLRHAYWMKRQGYFIYYFDTEGAVHDGLFTQYGFSKNDYEILPVNTVEDCRRQMFSIADKYEEFINTLDEKSDEYKNRPKMAFYLDSIGNMSSTKSVKDTKENKDTKDMSKQQQLHRLFLDLTVKLANARIPLLLTNHVYDVIGAYVPTKEMKGGGGSKYNSSNIIMLKKKDIKNEKTGKYVGSELTATIKKSRYCRPRLSVKIYLDYEMGLMPYYGLDEIALEAGLISKVKVGTRNTYLIMDPKIPKDQWMSIPCAEINKKSTIGTIMDEMNEWVKKNFVLTTVVGDGDDVDNASNDFDVSDLMMEGESTEETADEESEE